MRLGLLSIAGTQCRAEGRGFWWASVPRNAWPRHPQFRALIGKHWSPVWGDRRQELVFIGMGLAKDAICAALDACLIGEESGFDPTAVRRLRDPFPEWQHAHAA